MQEWKLEIECMKTGLSEVEECTGREAYESEMKQKKEVDIRVSKSTYTRLSKKAKRAHMNVSEFLEKLAGEK